MNNQVHQLSRAIQQLAHQQKTPPSSLATTRVSSLRKRVIRLSRRLRAYAGQSAVKTLLALAAAVLTGSGTDAFAQRFAAPIENPFGLELDPTTPGEDFIIPSFGDIDGDGDLDMISVAYDERKFIFQENIGSATVPAFGARQINPFGIIFSSDISYAFPTLADVDDDGDLDLLSQFNSYSYDSLGNYNGNTFVILYSENEGTLNTPAFGDTMRIAVDDFNEFFVGAKLVDLDGDGDLDLVGSGYDSGAFSFAKNVALPSALPSFGPVQSMPFGLTAQIDTYEYISFGDLDQDGDLDMLSYGSNYSYGGSFSADFIYRENVGTSSSPQFSTPVLNPFGLSADNENDFGIPSIVDIDSDGDLDLFVLTYNEEAEVYQLSFHENTSTVSTNEFYTTDVVVYPNPASSQLTLQTTGVIEQLNAIDVLGVSHSLEVHGNNQVDVSHLPTGAYTVFAVLDGGERLQAKLVKQ